jgi:predicted dehydrogenase
MRITMESTLKIALVGAGMFGGDVHARAYADLQRFGIAGQLARVGLDKYSRDLAPVKFDLVAVATRSVRSLREEGRRRFQGAHRPRAACLSRRRTVE